jgi:excinuclease ABC subunit C
MRLRDTSFPYIAVTVEDDYPRSCSPASGTDAASSTSGRMRTRRRCARPSMLNRCSGTAGGPQPGRHSGIPCLDFHIERCHAPCVGYISKEDYGELIEQVIEFLSGDDRPIRRRLTAVREAATEERFENAARCRTVSLRSRAERAAGGRAEVDRARRRRVAVSEERAAVQVFPLRGRMVDPTRSTSRTPPRTSTKC